MIEHIVDSGISRAKGVSTGRVGRITGMTDTAPLMDPRAAAMKRAANAIDYDQVHAEKEQADRTRLVNLMIAIERLRAVGVSKAEIATWHTDTGNALCHLTVALPDVHQRGTAALQKRVYSEIQTLANRLMDEKRWVAKT